MGADGGDRGAQGKGRDLRRFRQQIPRPADTTSGRSPTWSTLGREMRRTLPLDRFRNLEEIVEATEPPTEPTDEGEGRPASFAVLVPLFPRDGEATVLLIRRSAAMRRDPGNVAFPGGGVEPGETPLEAALRETAEEIGLAADRFTALRQLPRVQRRDGERVAAYAGLLDERPALSPNRAEVDAVLEVPLVTLLADGVGWQERWAFGGEERRIHFFADPDALGDDLIWGLTAGILWSLLEWAVVADSDLD